MKRTFENLIKEHQEWAVVTFPNITSKGSLSHAQDEIREIIDDIDVGNDKKSLSKEYVDALFCIMSSAILEGISVQDIVDSGYEKLQINKERKWKDNGDGSYSHIKTAEI